MATQIEIEIPEFGLTGSEIIQDVCGRIESELSKSCHLRETDSYGGYSARLVFEIRPIDIDPVTVEGTLVVNNHDSSMPSRRFEMNFSGSPEAVRQRSGSVPPPLERMVDGSAPEVAPARKRFYARPAKAAK